MDAPNSSNTRNKLHTYKLAETWGQCVNSWVSIGYPPNLKDSRIGFRYLKKEKKRKEIINCGQSFAYKMILLMFMTSKNWKKLNVLNKG